MKQVLRKFIKKNIEGTTETIVNERIEKELLTKDEIQELIDFESDGEAAFFTYGLQIDYNEELCGIILDTLFEGLTDYLKDEDDEEFTSLRDILKKIEPYRVYDLDFEG